MLKEIPKGFVQMGVIVKGPTVNHEYEAAQAYNEGYVAVDAPDHVKLCKDAKGVKK